jgi:Zn-dependent protease with chaperone function
MHLLIILTALAVSCWLRIFFKKPQGTWGTRWRQVLFLFLFPPLLLNMTAIAVLCMGPQGKMVNWQTGSFSYVSAIIYIAFVAFMCIKLAYQGWQSVKSARTCPRVNIDGHEVRLLDAGVLFAGQIGFWQPELVVSEGLVQTLSPEHLETVLAHEQGHYHYRDTFWFFWLGWMRSCTAWLPNTDTLWQELLILRELRADGYAAAKVDPLLLAESLLLVVSNTPVISDICCAALGSHGTGDRLEQRIEALLTQTEPIPDINLPSWNSFFLAFLPLATVVFHS